ncbi:uncharacterized protein K452DRAFT_291382 [Aplosporella prunicola CBS 121167]|uniref:Uncharacterized protein n=1 Tax=Aplosporella prunicola CBS 121167 TaxID=1176127 RepID=A0A6A6B066_9PEZI|nr:uncharacterized protein K452DRAFT_291382 [Aplosporella prunicola CBS 121167]KAF2137569.1 hypothetical protein K452DRAFT_291382 [Aplosporella prunicola CBS 121167]
MRRRYIQSGYILLIATPTFTLAAMPINHRIACIAHPMLVQIFKLSETPAVLTYPRHRQSDILCNSFYPNICLLFPALVMVMGNKGQKLVPNLILMGSRYIKTTTGGTSVRAETPGQ